MNQIVYSLALFALVGCGSGGGSAADPRCNTLCTIKQPALADAYDICSEASAAACRADCDARIRGVNTVCASCLLDDACFSPGGCGNSQDPGQSCNNNVCTVKGRVGSCEYPKDNQAAYENCLRQVYPRRTIECAPSYRSTNACASSCKP